MHPKKIIKLDPKQQMLFGLLGQQIRPTRTAKSETADDGDLYKPPVPNWTHKASDKNVWVRDSQKLSWDFQKSMPGSLGLPTFKDI